MPCLTENNVSKKEKCKELVIDIPPDLGPAQWPDCCIYRVPKKLRKENKDAYTPRLISIGPLHHNNKDLRDMEMQKLRYFKEFFYRTTKTQKDLANVIEKCEIKIRHSYAVTPKTNKKEFVNMILLDAIFIIELFLKSSAKPEDKEDYILSIPLLRNDIKLDLILVENQLPFFILEDLYNLVFIESSSYNHHKEGKRVMEQNENQKRDSPFLKLCHQFFSSYDKQQANFSICKEVKHFTDLVRYLQFSQDLKPTGKINHLYCATELDDAGVKFKADKKNCLVDIVFKKSMCLERYPFFNCSWLLNCLPCLKCIPCFEHMQPFLVLPVFEVGNATECVFRNLIAFEQCHYPNHAFISSYILLLDFFINTEKDVDLLIERKVIVNRLGSVEAVATLVNKLGHQLVESNSCYYDLSKNLNGHCENFWNRNMGSKLMASLANVYFRDFWRGTSTVVAILFLLLTFGSFITPFVFQR